MSDRAHQAAIAGIGYGSFERTATITKEERAIAACRAALADAGVTADDVDCIAHWGISAADAPRASYVQAALGARNVDYRFNFEGYTGGADGTLGATTGLLTAAMAVASGTCTTALVYRCASRETNYHGRAKSIGHPEVSAGLTGVAQLPSLYGQQPGSVIDPAGQIMRRLMWRYGFTEEDFGLIAVNARRWSALNDRATMRDPITMEDYLSSRPISAPCKLLDCDYPVNAACAFIITSLERAADLRPPPVVIDAWAHNVDPPDDPEEYAVWATIGPLSQRLWERASVRPADVDVAELYDGFTVMAFNWLSALELCDVADTAAFLDGGRTIGPGGALPMNTAGGQLAEGRLHALGLVAEAALQVRGDCGPRQVPGAEVAVVTYGGSVWDGAWAAVLRADR